MQQPRLPSVFVGSSSEGIDIARNLVGALQRSNLCTVKLWDNGFFQLSVSTVEALSRGAQAADFAVLVVTPDDTITRRGESAMTPRDNVVFEAGLFVGALGIERTYLVVESTDKAPLLPSDLLGVTYAPFRRQPDEDLGVSLTSAVLKIEERIAALGRRQQSPASASPDAATFTSESDARITHVLIAAQAQGWRVRKHDNHVLRLDSPSGRRHTLSMPRGAATSEQLHTFTADLRGDGLRVSRAARGSKL